MSRYLIPAFCFVVSVAAKGRGGGGGSINIDDGWDAPPLLKAVMAFAIIFCIVALVLLFTIFKYLPGIRGMSARGPYILLSVVVVSYTIYYILWAAYVRLNGLHSLELAMDFFTDIFTAFLPAVVLYLLHQRGAVLRAAKGNTIVPLASHIWKQVFDWSLVGLTFVIAIAQLGIFGALEEIGNDSTSIEQELQYTQSLRGLGRASVAFRLLLCIDLIASLIIHYIQAKRVQYNDTIIIRLLIAAPFYAILAIESLTLYIVLETNLEYDRLAVAFAQTLIEGACKLIITGILILTMMLQNAQWFPQQAEALTTPPAEQWSQPNASWQQPSYNQQQQIHPHQAVSQP